MADVVMPRLSDSMEEGTILKWLKADGDEVARGDELVEIETDKATMTYEADQDGTLAIVAAEGDTLPIGEVIASIGEGGGAGGNGAAPEAAKPSAEPEPEPAAAPAAVEPERAETPAPAEGARIKASPVARRMATKLGLDLAALAGSGPGGRVVKADVEAAAEGGQPASAPAAEAPTAAPPAATQQARAPAVAETGTAKGDVGVEELSRTQQLIARRMAESKATIPEFTVTTEIDMEECVRGRAAMKAAAAEGDVVPSYNDMVVKAVAIALREHPRSNGAYKDGRFELYSRVNVGVAVAATDSLVVPTIFDADRRGLADIARATRALAGKVRDGTIAPPELSGGTFTVSNLGMFGVTHFTAVISTGQSGILAVGALEPKAVVRDGEIVARHMMAATLVTDHRIVYGADAARFLGRVRALLESPLSLAL